MSSRSEVEVDGRDWDSQRVIGMLNGKGSDTHHRNGGRKHLWFVEK